MKYQENLKFAHPFLWLVLLPILVLFGYGIVQQMILDKPFGNHPAPDHWLIISAIILLLILVLLQTASLRYSIDAKGFHYRFFPFHFKTYHLPWTAVQDIQIREYNALTEFGGWGIRINFKGNKAYNVMGDHGQAIEIIKTNGKKILFSTCNPQAIRHFLLDLSAKGAPISLQN